jgi:3-isopropylmalate dehydrogenase
MLPSASLGEGGPGLYEPIHGSAPDLAGQGSANPLGAIQSVAMMLRHSLDLPRAAADVHEAVSATITQEVLTPDLGGSANTEAVGEAVLQALTRQAVHA